MDWFLSPVGQQALSEALLLHSPRADVPAPAGSMPLQDMKLLIPADWHDFEKRPAGIRARLGSHRRRATLRSTWHPRSEAPCGLASIRRH
jgi:hypothetical protein